MTTLDKQEKMNLWEVYKEEDFIDAKDNQGDWRVGYVIGKNMHLKNWKIRFDGWSSKYDQVQIEICRAINMIVLN